MHFYCVKTDDWWRISIHTSPAPTEGEELGWTAARAIYSSQHKWRWMHVYSAGWKNPSSLLSDTNASKLDSHFGGISLTAVCWLKLHIHGSPAFSIGRFSSILYYVIILVGNFSPYEVTWIVASKCVTHLSYCYFYLFSFSTMQTNPHCFTTFI